MYRPHHPIEKHNLYRKIIMDRIIDRFKANPGWIGFSLICDLIMTVTSDPLLFFYINYVFLLDYYMTRDKLEKHVQHAMEFLRTGYFQK
jgi:hypothetical protein